MGSPSSFIARGIEAHLRLERPLIDLKKLTHLGSWKHREGIPISPLILPPGGYFVPGTKRDTFIGLVVP